jgi:site-specific DNA-methyltransferase (adenine-specific)
MKVVHLLRKPCSEGTVAANVLRWGTGALNIDASRVAFTSEADAQESKTKNQHANFDSAPITGNVAYGDYSMLLPRNYNPPGRWPANLVLQHLPECEGAVCAEECPVMALDAQSGVSKSTGGRTVTRSGGGNVGSGKTSEKSWSNDDPGFGDVGGASRFFKQVKA